MSISIFKDRFWYGNFWYWAVSYWKEQHVASTGCFGQQESLCRRILLSKYLRYLCAFRVFIYIAYIPLTLRMTFWLKFCHGFSPQGRRNSWSRSWNHLLATHFEPTKTGQAACRVLKSPSPLGSKLYHTAADPFSGKFLIPELTNTVPPPDSTSDM